MGTRPLVGNAHPKREQPGDLAHLFLGESSDYLGQFLSRNGHDLVDLNL